MNDGPDLPTCVFIAILLHAKSRNVILQTLLRLVCDAVFQTDNGAARSWSSEIKQRQDGS